MTRTNLLALLRNSRTWQLIGAPVVLAVLLPLIARFRR